MDTPSTSSGKGGEAQALHHLKNQGLKLLYRNFTCRHGEIDLIMRDQSYLVFVEVRLRSRSPYASAFESVTPTKQQKIITTAKYFLKKYRQYQQFQCRFDVVAIESGKIDWLTNAFC